MSNHQCLIYRPTLLSTPVIHLCLGVDTFNSVYSLLRTSLINSRIDYCNSLFLNLSSNQLNRLLLLSNPAPLLSSSMSLHLMQMRQGTVHKECPDGRRGPMQTGEVRGHADIRKTADNPGQNRSA